jgi:hypothetical protein
MWLCSFSPVGKFMFNFGIQKDLSILGFIVIFWHDNTWGRLRIFHGSRLDLMGDPELSKFWSNPLGKPSMAYKNAWRPGMEGLCSDRAGVSWNKDLYAFFVTFLSQGHCDS